MNRYVAALAVVLLAGCQSVQVEKRTVTLVGTTPDLYQDQVLKNLAMMAADRSAIPFFAVPQSGTNTNTRQLQAGYTPGWDFITSASSFAGRYLFVKHTAAISGQISNGQAFQMQPVYDPDKLVLMQTAYRKVLGDPTLTLAELDNLKGFFQNHDSGTFDYYRAITGMPLPCTKAEANEATCSFPDLRCGPFDPFPHQAEWLGVSCKKHDAKNACYVGEYCNSYVWVTDAGAAAFRAFTLAILDIATLAPQFAGHGLASAPEGKQYIQPRIMTAPFPAPVGMF